LSSVGAVLFLLRLLCIVAVRTLALAKTPQKLFTSVAVFDTGSGSVTVFYTIGFIMTDKAGLRENEGNIATGDTGHRGAR
jgi:hypothetical protein